MTTTESRFQLKFGTIVIVQTIRVQEIPFHVQLISDASFWGCDMTKWDFD